MSSSPPKKLLFAQTTSSLVTQASYDSDHPQYEIEMGVGNIFQKTTFVRKLDLNGGKQNIPHTNEEIARIHWSRSIVNKIVSDEIIFQGRSMPKDKFIQRARLDGKEGYIINAQGEDYQWILCDSDSPKLVKQRLGQKDILMAQFHRPSYCQLSDIKGSWLEVTQDGMVIVDQILVSFILIEKWFREQDKRPSPSPEPTRRA